jgi:chromate transporter
MERGASSAEGGPAAAPQPARVRPSFRAALRFWFKLGFIGFGGPSGQIAILHDEVVERRRWVSEPRFLHALNFCMLLPGPEATQLATYIGWLLHGVRGGVAAGVLFVLPAVFLLLGLSWVYAEHGEVPWIAALFDGLKPAVLALVIVAVVRIGSRTLKLPVMWILAAAALFSFRVLHAPFPLVIALAGLVGFVGARVAPRHFSVASPHAGAGSAAAETEWEQRDRGATSFGRAARVAAVCLALWWGPVVLAGLLRGWDDVLVTEGVFFSKTAVVTFGGAYAVLPYVAQHAVETHGWLAPHEMLDGLGLAETNPGPLIMVLQFVGFLGGWRDPGGLEPWQAGVLAGLMTTWVTFVPCFLWVLVGAPFVERLRGVRRLEIALSTVTAAVVGVMLNLALWFGYEALVPAAADGGRAPDPWAVGTAVAAWWVLQNRRVPTPVVLAGAAAIGLVRLALTG